MLAQNFLGELGFFFSHSQSRRDAEQEDELGTANRKTKVGRVAPPTAQASSAEAPFLIAPINLTQLHCLLMCECVGPFFKECLRHRIGKGNLQNSLLGHLILRKMRGKVA